MTGEKEFVVTAVIKTDAEKTDSKGNVVGGKSTTYNLTQLKGKNEAGLPMKMQLKVERSNIFALSRKDVIELKTTKRQATLEEMSSKEEKEEDDE